jgi:TPR repeat protein
VEVLSDGPDGVSGTEDDLTTAAPYGFYDEKLYGWLDPTPAESAYRSVEELEAKCREDTYLPFLSCQAAVRILLEGEAIPEDGERAIAVYSMACDRNIVEACEEAAQLLASGERVPRDAERAEGFLVKTRAILEKACAPGARYRSTYAPKLIRMYEAGRGGPRDIPRALELCEWLRAQKTNGACPELGRLRSAASGEKR